MSDFEPPIIDLAPWLVVNGESVRIIGTRTTAQKVIAAHPEVRADLAVYIDCRAVKVISSPFIRELLDAWPKAQPLGGSEDVADTWALVWETP